MKPRFLSVTVPTAVVLLLIVATLGCSIRRETSALRDDIPLNASSSWLKDNRDQDSDGDGLSDFQERHKYFTDPTKADTDGDGIPDSDAAERREYAYSIRNIMEILKPADLDAMNSDYQDAKLLEDRGNSIVVEFVYYPLNTVASGIQANPDWQADYKDMTTYLAPTKTANWDESMRQRLLTDLAQAGINPAELDDVTLVQRVSQWVMSNFSGDAPFVAFVADVNGDAVTMHPGLAPVFKQDNPDVSPSDLAEYLQSGVLGKKMVLAHHIGSCTPSAIVMTTIFRALGIPTRLIMTVPAIDANDDQQIQNATTHLSHHKTRATAIRGFKKGQGWASHTYNEVFVGHRWIKLNYNRLGQNSLDPYYFGIMTQVNTLQDWTDANYPATWGKRILQAINNQLDPAMSSRNQYRSIEIDDLFGGHANVPNPEAQEHKQLTISDIFTTQDARLPQVIRDQHISATAGVIYLITADEFLPELDDSQYGEFLDRAPWRLTLKANNGHSVHAEIDKSAYWTADTNVNGQKRIAPFYSLWISTAEYAQMTNGTAYKITIDNNGGDYKWIVKDSVLVVKP